MRNQFGTPSSQAKQHGTSQQTQPQKASCSDKAMHNEKQSPTYTHLRNALNSSWDRIVVSSDVASKLSLQEVRQGIETFLASRVNQRMVFKDRIIRLHWDGKDLGTFRYKDSVTSAPTITIQDIIIISSSDDEVTKVDTASSVTPPTVGTSGGVTRDPHVTADGSKESVLKDIKTPIEPRVILAVCSTSDSADCSDMDDVTDGRKAPKSSDEDPTYSPDEEEISSEDKTSLDNSDSEVCSEPSSGSFVNPSEDNGFDASSTQDSLLGPSTENQYSFKPLGKGHKKKHIGSCENSSPKKRQLRHHYLRPNARKRKYSDDSFDSSQSDIDISSDKSSSPIQRRNAKKSRARRPQDCTAIIPKTLSRQTAKVIPDIVVPADIICQPCSVQLLRLKDNLLHNGRVNLSVIKVEELFVTDNNVTASDDTWACIANTLSLAHELDIGSPW
uniref:Uncharacterized protein n=1 Tax=Rhipicephalus microplus TaxID=6941 RepID=A0A6M2D407_RHIMP